MKRKFINLLNYYSNETRDSCTNCIGDGSLLFSESVLRKKDDRGRVYGDIFEKKLWSLDPRSRLKRQPETKSNNIALQLFQNDTFSKIRSSFFFNITREKVETNLLIVIIAR